MHQGQKPLDQGINRVHGWSDKRSLHEIGGRVNDRRVCLILIEPRGGGDVDEAHPIPLSNDEIPRPVNRVVVVEGLISLHVGEKLLSGVVNPCLFLVAQVHAPDHLVGVLDMEILSISCFPNCYIGWVEGCLTNGTKGDIPKEREEGIEISPRGSPILGVVVPVQQVGEVNLHNSCEGELFIIQCLMDLVQPERKHLICRGNNRKVVVGHGRSEQKGNQTVAT